MPCWTLSDREDKQDVQKCDFRQLYQPLQVLPVKLFKSDLSTGNMGSRRTH